MNVDELDQKIHLANSTSTPSHANACSPSSPSSSPLPQQPTPSRSNNRTLQETSRIDRRSIDSDMDNDVAADFPSSPDLEDFDAENDTMTNTDDTAMLITPNRQQWGDKNGSIGETAKVPALSQMLPPPPRPSFASARVSMVASSAVVDMPNRESSQPRLISEPDLEPQDSTLSNPENSSSGALPREDGDVMDQSISEDDIEPFAWADLELRYHDRVQELDTAQNQILDDFKSLSSYFAVWADVGSKHEIERSFKRLKTQMTLVQHHETQLEQRRQHYLKVVDAFKSALDLLAT